MPDLELISKWIGVVTAISSGSYAALQAGVSWREKAADTRRQSSVRRMEELRKLIAKRGECQDVLDDLFDYASNLDEHLRLNDLVFTDAEIETRVRADRAFEHFREVHRSVEMGLIEAGDLGPWVYWIHRVRTRTPLHAYAVACGYESFMNELASWTAGSAELALLVQKCPWWETKR